MFSRATATAFLTFLGIALAPSIQGLSPSEALERMKVPEGLEISLVAHEPAIRQPVAMQFDSMGRLWVLQYLQYPNPAGLQAIKVDQYLRTTYDRIPEPPPRGPKGADKITICTDSDGDGKADQFKDFVSGLNLASGFAIGNGGVYVAQPPYLLFYPDQNQDDLPDGDPTVLLEGFGMEDAHAFANSLQWGPDGWLYGAQGSTVTAKIRGLEFQQGIWRYHPTTKKFELFAEGGGNTWGLDFDEEGNILAGTNYGEEAMLHQVEGAYYVKNFGKHGELHHPHAYGYFGHVPYRQFKGGHVTCGGILFYGAGLPPAFRGTYIAANPLSRAIHWHLLEPQGSSFQARHGGELVTTTDPEFRPIDCLVGPDGALYIADWTDQRLTHVDPKDNWDRSNGRIYRVQQKGYRPAHSTNIRSLTQEQLLDQLAKDPAYWTREKQRRLVSFLEKKNEFVLEKWLQNPDPRVSLHALWVRMSLTPKPTASELEVLLRHTSPAIRAWTVRWLGSEGLTPEVFSLLRNEKSPRVLSQLFSTLKGGGPVDMVFDLLPLCDPDDPHLPLLAWWALEAKTLTETERLVDRAADPSMQSLPFFHRHLLQRLGRRYAAEPLSDPLVSMLEKQKLENLPTLLAGIDAGMQKIPAPLQPLLLALEQVAKKMPDSALLLRLQLKCRDPGALTKVRERMAQAQTSPADLKIYLEALSFSGLAREDDFVPFLNQEATRDAALTALGQLGTSKAGQHLMAHYLSAPAKTRSKVRALLASRSEWALKIVQEMDAGRIPAADFSTTDLQQIKGHQHPQLNAWLLKHFGNVQAGPRIDLEKRFHEVKLTLAPSGETQRLTPQKDQGKALFMQTCGQCHRFKGEGKDLGPDLTGADRKNREAMITSIVNPSGYVRPEYLNYQVRTKDGQLFAGLLHETDASRVVLRNTEGETTILKKDVDDLKPAETSLMPEGLLDGLTPQQLVDLFGYLED